MTPPDSPPISVSAAALELNVSPATIRNWLKTGAAGDGSMASLRRLASERLTRRANKANSRGFHLPKERTSNPQIWECVRQILTIHETLTSAGTDSAAFADHFAVSPETASTSTLSPISEALLFLTIRHFISLRSVSPLLHAETDAWQHALEFRFPTLNGLSETLSPSLSEAVRSSLSDLADGGSEDFPGILYQSLTRNGTKAVRGSFYSPAPLAAEALAELAQTTVQPASFLDPCCGTGAFLREARREFHLPLNALFGCDLDPIAVRIARINLLLDAPDAQTPPGIFCQNGLAPLPKFFPKTFDLIATNPPWGASRQPAIHSDSAAFHSREETFARFLRHAWELLTPGGQAAFLLPEAFANIRIHAGIRQFLLENARIRSLHPLGRAFSGVFTPVVRLHFEKNPPLPERDSRQLACLRTPGFIIPPSAASQDAQLIAKMLSVPHETLQGNAVWGLGIVTGNNRKWLRKKTDFPETQNDPESVTGTANWEPILCGPDVEPFRIRTPQTLIRFEPEHFQQALPEFRFRVPEKIVYRFITSRPTFALDGLQRLTLNSANFLIPAIPGLSTKAVLAFLNSEAFRFLFRKWFFTHKVLRGDLERLPFPKISQKIARNLEKLVDRIFSGEAVCGKMNTLIFSAFELTCEEITQIRRSFEP